MMRRPFFYLMTCIAILMVLPSLSFAKTGWVSDMLLLTFRQGPGNNFAVEKTLPSNTPVTILDEQNRFYKVELQSREIGWVDQKFIIFEEPKAVLLEQAKQQTAVLKAKIEKQAREIGSLKQTFTSKEQQYSGQMAPLQASLKKGVAENSTLKKELAQSREKYSTLIKQSKNIQEIIKENNRFKEENKKLSADLKSLKGKNRNLFKTAMIKWFLAGVGVLLLGWLIGKSVSSKRSGYGSLLD